MADYIAFVPRITRKAFRRFDISGETFGSLTVLGCLGRNFNIKQRSYVWLCKCECGNLQAVLSSSLKRKSRPTRKCSTCYSSAIFSNQPWYYRYKSMVARCYDQKRTGYKSWGGRGIRVCDEWLNDPWQYHRDVGDPPRKGMQVDRIDNDGDYEPSNVRWADQQDQIHNSRITKLSWPIVRAARKRADAGECIKDIWKDMSPNVTYTNFVCAVRRKTWKEKSEIIEAV